MARPSVEQVRELHRVFGGDPVLEDLIIRFIADRYGAEDLFAIPEPVVREMLARPADFRRAVLARYQPAVPF